MTARRKSSRRVKSSEKQSRVYEDYDDMLELEQSLAIDELRLNDALSKQPELFYRVAKALALTISRRDAAKQALQDIEAQAELEIRAEAAEEERKMNNDEVRATVHTDSEVMAARQVLTRLNESVGSLGALKDAFQQRSYALKDLAELYVANYYGASADNAGSRVRNRSGTEAREAMAEKRRGG